MKTNALSIQPDHAGPQSDRRGGRRPVRALVGVAAGVLLAVAVPAAASAHVHVDPGEAPAGATERLTFSFSHGCEGSPTTALVFDIPDEVGNATPIVSGGWTITRELGTDGLPTQITYTAGAPLDGGIKAELSMDVRFEESAEGTEVAFPVTQGVRNRRARVDAGRRRRRRPGGAGVAGTVGRGGCLRGGHRWARG